MFKTEWLCGKRFGKSTEKQQDQIEILTVRKSDKIYQIEIGT